MSFSVWQSIARYKHPLIYGGISLSLACIWIGVSWYSSNPNNEYAHASADNPDRKAGMDIVCENNPQSVCAIIRWKAWSDTNNNNTYDQGIDTVFANIKVRLAHVSAWTYYMITYVSATTDADGNYQFVYNDNVNRKKFRLDDKTFWVRYYVPQTQKWDKKLPVTSNVWNDMRDSDIKSTLYDIMYTWYNNMNKKYQSIYSSTSFKLQNVTSSGQNLLMYAQDPSVNLGVKTAQNNEGWQQSNQSESNIFSLTGHIGYYKGNGLANGKIAIPSRTSQTNEFSTIIIRLVEVTSSRDSQTKTTQTVQTVKQETNPWPKWGYTFTWLDTKLQYRIEYVIPSSLTQTIEKISYKFNNAMTFDAAYSYKSHGGTEYILVTPVNYKTSSYPVWFVKYNDVFASIPQDTRLGSSTTNNPLIKKTDELLNWKYKFDAINQWYKVLRIQGSIFIYSPGQYKDSAFAWDGRQDESANEKNASKSWYPKPENVVVELCPHPLVAWVTTANDGWLIGTDPHKPDTYKWPLYATDMSLPCIASGSLDSNWSYHFTFYSRKTDLINTISQQLYYVKLTFKKDFDKNFVAFSEHHKFVVKNWSPRMRTITQCVKDKSINMGGWTYALTTQLFEINKKAYKNSKWEIYTMPLLRLRGSSQETYFPFFRTSMGLIKKDKWLTNADIKAGVCNTNIQQQDHGSAWDKPWDEQQSQGINYNMWIPMPYETVLSNNDAKRSWTRFVMQWNIFEYLTNGPDYKCLKLWTNTMCSLDYLKYYSQTINLIPQMRKIPTQFDGAVELCRISKQNGANTSCSTIASTTVDNNGRYQFGIYVSDKQWWDQLNKYTYMVRIKWGYTSYHLVMSQVKKSNTVFYFEPIGKKPLISLGNHNPVSSIQNKNFCVWPELESVSSVNYYLNHYSVPSNNKASTYVAYADFGLLPQYDTLNKNAFDICSNINTNSPDGNTDEWQQSDSQNRNQQDVWASRSINNIDKVSDRRLVSNDEEICERTYKDYYKAKIEIKSYLLGPDGKTINGPLRPDSLFGPRISLYQTKKWSYQMPMLEMGWYKYPDPAQTLSDRKAVTSLRNPCMLYYTKDKKKLEGIYRLHYNVNGVNQTITQRYGEPTVDRKLGPYVPPSRRWGAYSNNLNDFHPIGPRKHWTRPFTLMCSDQTKECVTQFDAWQLRPTLYYGRLYPLFNYGRHQKMYATNAWIDILKDYLHPDVLYGIDKGENSFNNYINRYTYLPYVWMNDPKSPLSIYQWNNIVYTLWWGGSCTFHFMHKSIQKERWVLLSESDMNKLPKWFKFDPCDPQSVKQVETTLGRKLETGIELWGKWNTKLTNALSDPIDEKTKSYIQAYLQTFQNLKNNYNLPQDDCKLLMGVQNSIVNDLFGRTIDNRIYTMMPYHINLQQIIPFVKNSYFVAVWPNQQQVAHVISYKLTETAKYNIDMQQWWTNLAYMDGLYNKLYNASPTDCRQDMFNLNNIKTSPSMRFASYLKSINQTYNNIASQHQIE